MADTLTRKDPVPMNYLAGQVTVAPADLDLFVRSAEKAIEACRDKVGEDERIAVFTNRFLVPLHEWCVRHADQVAACYVPRPAGQIQAFLVTTSPRFDFALGEEIASLERDLAHAGWRISLWQLPAAEDRSVAAFFNPEGALEVYAQPGPTPPNGPVRKIRLDV